MRKITVKEFGQFKRWFISYQKKFSKLDFRIYFHNKPLTNKYSCILTDTNERTANAILTSEIVEEDFEGINIKGSAKHESIHLLLADLKELALSRSATEKAIRKEIESLVKILEKVID